MSRTISETRGNWNIVSPSIEAPKNLRVAWHVLSKRHEVFSRRLMHPDHLSAGVAKLAGDTLYDDPRHLGGIQRLFGRILLRGHQLSEHLRLSRTRRHGMHA